jgi:hypothetical protein
MPNKQFSDIIPQKKSTTDKRSASVKVLPKKNPTFPPSRVKPLPKASSDKPRAPKAKKGKLVWIVLAVLVAFVGISSLFFEQTILTITPKQSVAPIDTVIVAIMEGSATPAPDINDDELTFETLTLAHTVRENLPATEVRRVEKRASGNIVIFNAFSSAPQELIKNTRFETPEGLIYRIRESVVVPGQKKKNGESLPGSVDVTIYADEPGDDYNIGLTDFTIPGFKGTPRFSSFYARSATDMSGGFSGVVQTISEEELERAKNALKARAREELLARAITHVPEEFILYPDAIFVTFESDLPLKEASQGKETVEVSLEGTLHGFMFVRSKFSMFLAKLVLPDLKEGESVGIQNLSTIALSLQEKSALQPQSLDSFSFSVKGTPNFVWDFDEEALRSSLAGNKKDELRIILAEFPGVTRAEVTVRPFWKRSFPENLKDIEIEKVINGKTQE